MNDAWTDRWNERYKTDTFAYGREPNRYFQQQLDRLVPGALLLPAEGEGRNAVYAARNGWKVSAFDISAEGKSKALQLAAAAHVTIDYQVGLLENLHYSPGQFDAIALIYAHFPADIKSNYHKTLDTYLRKGGVVILEAFSKNHLDYIARDKNVGGPTDIAMLFSTEEIRNDFSDYDVIQLEETEIELHEGLFHNGKGSVIRFTGRKKQDPQ